MEILRVSDDLHATPGPPLAANHLPAFFRPHAGPKADLAGSLHFADSMRVMHGCRSFA
jgi:hypothetical protein